MVYPVFVLESLHKEMVAAAAEAGISMTPWTSVCHRKAPMVTVEHSYSQVMPYAVRFCRPGPVCWNMTLLSRHKTLKSAVKKAKKVAKEWAANA